MQPKHILITIQVHNKLVDFPNDKVDDFTEKLFKFYSRSARYQTKQGVTFELTFSQYIDKFTNNQLNSLARSYLRGKIEGRQRSDFKLVLSWASRQDKLNGVMNDATAIICGQKESMQNCRYLPGEERSEKTRKRMAAKKLGKKRPESVRTKISETKTGQKYDETHCANISAGLKGKPKSAESNAKRAAAAKARWAAAREAKTFTQSEAHK
ncbi:hypothetical protein [Brucella rhizosphaerae]|uniref:Uncharacterized protein n=1 Tax=Brucella rhizosphaerae TaxID=571254 RepID=A0A256F8V1_9HYPH|nr:hypothetical protein [Brucella rhizosphaerae]OYR11203.1 hypothetical protein CEV32_1501 [Brucella rhizosphaerae]